MLNARKKVTKIVHKAIDFTKKFFSSVLRSRTGAMTELARLLRFKTGTKGFMREHERLLPLTKELKDAFKKTVLSSLPKKGLRIGIIDDTPVKKSGEKFPKEQVHHDHTTNSFYKGLKVLSSMVYQAGKTATISSKIVGKEDNKLHVANKDITTMVTDFLVDIFLFDSWYCKSSVLKHIEEAGKLFVSRIRCDSKVILEEGEVRLDELATVFEHKGYQKVKIHGRSYWVKELILSFKTYGVLKVILSKEGQYDKPIFLVTNAEHFSAKYVVMLYLIRFSIEIFFKDAKQFLNFETFLCRKDPKWELHFDLIHILHWAIQKRYSISRVVRAIRENINKCLLFINENQLINNFLDEVKKMCQT